MNSPSLYIDQGWGSKLTFGTESRITSHRADMEHASGYLVEARANLALWMVAFNHYRKI